MFLKILNSKRYLIYTHKSLKLAILALFITTLVIFSGCTSTAPPINHPPTIVSLTANPQSPIEVNQSTVITCLATDQDGDTLTHTWTKTGGTITESGSTITWTAPAIAGTYTITCTVSDGELGDIQSILIVVLEPEPENQPPVITSTPLTTATVGETYIYDVDATDPDGDTLTYSLTAGPAGMTIVVATGVISWIPATTGSYDVTVEVSDGNKSATQLFTITVDEALLTSIVVSPATMTIEAGNSDTITSVTAHYDNGTEASIALSACTYGSNNTSVTVNNGIINVSSSCTATTAIITVSYTEGGVTKRDTVTVTVPASGG